MQPTATALRVNPHADDLELARRVLQRRRDAIDQFMRRMTCVLRMLRVQNRRLGGPLGADELTDLSQDVLVIVWRKLSLFEGRSTLETWIFRICRLELLNSVRRRHRLAEPVDEVTPDQIPVVDEPDADAVMVDAEVAYHALNEIGPPPSEIILMKHFDQMTFAEIGSQLGLSANTTKSHYYRGLTRLREVLGLDVGEAA